MILSIMGKSNYKKLVCSSYIPICTVIYRFFFIHRLIEASSKGGNSTLFWSNAIMKLLKKKKKNSRNYKNKKKEWYGSNYSAVCYVSWRCSFFRYLTRFNIWPKQQMILFFDFYFFLELFFLFFIYFPAQNDFQRVNQKPFFYTH